MPKTALAAPLRPETFRLETSSNPMSWVFAEYEPGKRITQDMVDFDLDRSDVHVNVHGVVHFYSAQVARQLLRMPAA